MTHLRPFLSIRRPLSPLKCRYLGKMGHLSESTGLWPLHYWWFDEDEVDKSICDIGIESTFNNSLLLLSTWITSITINPSQRICSSGGPAISSSCSPPWPGTLDHANSDLSSSVPAAINTSPLIHCIDDKQHYYPHLDYHGPQSSTPTYFLPSTPTTTTTTPSSSSTTSYRHSTYHHRHPSLRYHPYSRHSTITNDNNKYNTTSSSSSTPSYTSSPSLSSSSSLFSTLLPDQTLSPASSVSSSFIDNALLSSTDDSHVSLSSFALFGTLSSSSATQYDDYHNNNIYHHHQQQDTGETNQDVGDIMDDDDIFNDFAQLAPPTTAASHLIQSPPTSPLLLPQDLTGADDFLLF
ncbi:unnamed protein product [Absidia cylindrospora]